MDYQELYRKYQNAVRLRDLAANEDYILLHNVFKNKIIESININTQNCFIPYLAGIKEVFNYVGKESSQIEFYRNELDKAVSNK